MDKRHSVRGAYYRPTTPEYLNFAKQVDPKTAWLAGGNIYLPAEKIVSPDNLLYGRRANPENKFGTKDRMESLNTPYDKETMANLLKAYKDAADRHGVKMLDPDDLVNLALVEGRSNFGYNDYNVNNKKAVKIAQDLQTIGHDPYAAGFPAAIVDKQMTAQRLGVPFFQVWNGGGKAAKDYNSRIQTQRYAVQDPRNQDLRGHVYQSLGLKPPQIRSEADIVEEEQSFKRGGLVDKSISGGSKLI